MEWQRLSISTVADVISGGTPKTDKPEYWDGDIPWLSVKDFAGDQKYVYKAEKSITPLGLQKSATTLLEKDDIIISARGTVGEVAQIPFQMAFNQSCFGLRAKKGFSPDFLYYALKYQMKQVKSISNGAVFDTIIIKTFDKIKCYFPSLSEQQRIASILSAYDSQIENNQKRIKLLEQMAENLYKEWFVRFRFPGYETVEFEGGIPKGWGKGSVATYAEIMSGGTPKTDVVEYYGGNIPFFTPKDATDGFFSCSTFTMITEDGLNHCNSRYYPKNTITITARGTVGRVNMMGVPMAMNQSCFALKSKYSGSNIYLFFALKEASAMMKKMASGGVFDTIVLKTFDHISILNPSVELLSQFDIIVSPILDTILMLQKNNDILTTQRDLLLPRLMSGKLTINV